MPRFARCNATVLFVAASPVGYSDLRLGAEARAIEDELARSTHRNAFRFVTKWAVQPADLMRALRKVKPAVVHFAGHATSDAVYLEDAAGDALPVTTAALAQAFAACRSIRLVVLNACYTAAQAQAIAAQVDAAVGTSNAIGDDAARAYATELYGSLGDGLSLAEAHTNARAATGFVSTADADTVTMIPRDGRDPADLRLGTACVPRFVWILAALALAGGAAFGIAKLVGGSDGAGSIDAGRVAIDANPAATDAAVIDAATLDAAAVDASAPIDAKIKPVDAVSFRRADAAWPEIDCRYSNDGGDLQSGSIDCRAPSPSERDLVENTMNLARVRCRTLVFCK